MEFTTKNIKKGPLTRVGVEMSLPEADTSTRGKIRKKINEDVGDVYTLLADANEMISLLMSTASALYSIQSAESLALLPPEKKDFIDYAMNKFDQIRTTADDKFDTDPVGTINQLMDDQNQINVIITDINKNG